MLPGFQLYFAELEHFYKEFGAAIYITVGKECLCIDLRILV